MEDGEIEMDSIEPIGFADITPPLARESGFRGVIDLQKVAKRGKGDRIYLTRFHYLPPGLSPVSEASLPLGRTHRLNSACTTILPNPSP